MPRARAVGLLTSYSDGKNTSELSDAVGSVASFMHRLIPINVFKFRYVLLGGESTPRLFINMCFELHSRRAASNYYHEASFVLSLCLFAFCVGYVTCNMLLVAGQPNYEAAPYLMCFTASPSHNDNYHGASPSSLSRLLTGLRTSGASAEGGGCPLMIMIISYGERP